MTNSSHKRELIDLAESIVDTIREPLLVLNGRLQVRHANKAFYRVFKTTPAETDDKFIFELGNGQWDSKALKHLLLEIVPTNSAVEDFEVEHDFPSIGKRTMLLNARRLALQDKDSHILLVIEDVTDKKKALQELELKTQQLTRSNRDLEQFAYVASHDLQEPLRMVVSFTKLLTERYKGKLDSDADEFIGYAVDGAMRMQKLINDLLAYSRLNTQGSNPKTIEMEKVLTLVLDRLSMAIEETQASVSHDPLPSVFADESQMAQVFQNLLGNSLKFRSRHQPRIHVSAAKDERGWTFCVSDNGIGFDPQFKDRIFLIFERLHGQDVPGTGIGLALCKRIIEHHGGKLWVESAPGAGSKFSFTIPTQEDRGERIHV